MMFPKLLKKVNAVLAFISGMLVLVTGIFAVYEAIVRACGNPTKWTLNVSCYILIWAIFLASPYSFQSHGHVAVDLFKDLIDKKFPNRIPRRVCAIISYLVCIVFVSSLLYAGWRLVVKAVTYGTLTTTTMPIPLAYLQVAIVVGSILMLVTLIFIIIDLLSGGTDYM